MPRNRTMVQREDRLHQAEKASADWELPKANFTDAMPMTATGAASTAPVAHDESAGLERYMQSPIVPDETIRPPHSNN